MSEIKKRTLKDKWEQTREWLKDFWVDYYEEIVSGVVVFLLVSLAFGAGLFFGSRLYQDSQININCPASFWENGN